MFSLPHHHLEGIRETAEPSPCFFFRTGNTVNFRQFKSVKNNNPKRNIISEINEGKIKYIIYIYLCPYNISNVAELESYGHTYLNDKFPKLDFKFEFIQLSELEIRQLIERDYSSIELIISNLKEKVLSQQISDKYKSDIIDNSNIDFELNEEEIEDIEELREKLADKSINIGNFKKNEAVI